MFSPYPRKLKELQTLGRKGSTQTWRLVSGGAISQEKKLVAVPEMLPCVVNLKLRSQIYEFTQIYSNISTPIS